MAARRTITAIASASVLAMALVPAAAGAGAAPLGAASAARWYEGRTGTVQWAIGAEFMQQVVDGGADLSVCSAAKVAVDEASGISIVTLPVHGNSMIQLNGSKSGVDAVSDCLVTISGNGATVELTQMYFSVSDAYPSGISATFDGEYIDVGSGAARRLPKQATRNRITVVSPVIQTEPTFNDLVRTAVPSMTTEPVNIGVFRLSLKVKSIPRPPMSSGNSEG